MFLLILEQIGNMELLFIGLIVLIVFGPRKIPELAKTAGKWMYEIRKVSNEFRETWEREAELTDEEKNVFDFDENTIAVDPELPEIGEVTGEDGSEFDLDESDVEQPSVTEVTDEDKIEALKKQASETAEAAEVEPKNDSLEKQNWL